MPIRRSHNADPEEKTLRRATRPLVLALLAAVLLASGCGSSSDGDAGDDGAVAAEASPAEGSADLLARAVTAAQGMTSAHYALDATVSVKAAGQVVNPQVEMLAQSPFTLHLEGDASETAFTADGSIGFAGQTLTGTFLAGEHELFLNFMGTWYGTKDTGLADAEEQGAAGVTANPQEALDAIRGRLDDVLTGNVSEGPESDGVETWRFEGTLNVDGLAELAAELGEAIPAADLDVLRAIAGASKVVVLFGRGDSLPRRFEFSLALSGDELAQLGAGATGLEGVESLNVDVSVDVSDFGKDVSYDAPAEFAPFDELLGQLLGLMGAGA